MSIGNSFNTKTIKVGHARKVWRSVRAVYPGGGSITNVEDWVEKGVIPSGRPCKFDPKTKQIKVYTPAQVKTVGVVPEEEGATAPTIESLGINGYIQEDVPIVDKNTIGTATVVYNGELYEFMFASDELAILKTNTATPQIVWVY